MSVSFGLQIFDPLSGRRGHRVFLDAEVLRGAPLLEVAGHGREAWRAAPGSARLP